MKSIIKSIFAAFLLCVGFGYVYAQSTNTIIPPAYTTFFDQNGNPLSGGKVFFYIPLTTVNKSTFKDAAGTLPNTQPVVLDAAGKALILGFGSYRQVVFDQNNNQIWDQTTASVGGGAGGVSSGDGLAVGTVLPWTGFVAPTNYAFASGQTLSRTINSVLMSALTQVESVTCSGGSPVLTSVADTSQIPIGAAIEGACFVNSIVQSVTSNSITINNNASVGLTVTATIFPYGDGDGASTFTLPDYRGKYLPGRCNMGGAACTNLVTPYFGTNTASALGANGGNQSSALALTNLPPITPTGTIANGAITIVNGSNVYVPTSPTATAAPTGALGFATVALSATQAASTFTGTGGGGSSTPFSIIPPSETVNYIIKIFPDIFTSGFSQILGTSPINVTTLGTVATVSLNSAAVTGLPNTALVNSSVTINGVACTLGTTCSVTGNAIIVLSPSRLATTGALAANTYNNGASGVGATLTGNANGALSIDGLAVITSDIVLIKNEVAQANNGIYTVTQTGDGSHPYILTRATYFNQASNMLQGSYTAITQGSINANTSYTLTNTTTTVGTTAVVFNLFLSFSNSVNNLFFGPIIRAAGAL